MINMHLYIHNRPHAKHKTRMEIIFLPKPPNNRLRTCLSYKTMIIFCAKRNSLEFPEPQDTTQADEVFIRCRSATPSTIIVNIDGTIYLYFHSCPQDLNKALRKVYTEKVGSKLTEAEQQQVLKI